MESNQQQKKMLKSFHHFVCVNSDKIGIVGQQKIYLIKRTIFLSNIQLYSTKMKPCQMEVTLLTFFLFVCRDIYLFSPEKKINHHFCLMCLWFFKSEYEINDNDNQSFAFSPFSSLG